MLRDWLPNLMHENKLASFSLYAAVWVELQIEDKLSARLHILLLVIFKLTFGITKQRAAVALLYHIVLPTSLVVVVFATGFDR